MSIQVVAGNFVDDRLLVEISPSRWPVLIKDDYFGCSQSSEMFNLAFPWVQLRLMRQSWRTNQLYYRCDAWSFSHQSVLIEARADAPPFFATESSGSFCSEYLAFHADMNDDPARAAIAASQRTLLSGGAWSYASGLAGLKSWQRLAKLAGVSWPEGFAYPNEFFGAGKKYPTAAMAAREVLSWWEAQAAFPPQIPLRRPLDELMCGRKFQGESIALNSGPVLVP